MYCPFIDWFSQQNKVPQQSMFLRSHINLLSTSPYNFTEVRTSIFVFTCLATGTHDMPLKWITWQYAYLTSYDLGARIVNEVARGYRSVLWRGLINRWSSVTRDCWFYNEWTQPVQHSFVNLSHVWQLEVSKLRCGQFGQLVSITTVYPIRPLQMVVGQAVLAIISLYTITWWNV